MISIIFSWSVIVVCSFIVGATAISCFYGKNSVLSKEYESNIFAGLAFWTFYAQIWSLFDGVKSMAVIGMLIITAIALFGLTKSGYDFKAILVGIKDLSSIKKISVLLAFIGALLWTNMVPQHYDTYLYHAQAVHWIEEYGVVPGLANLHFRLGYNSAFMSLQALFSFKWLFGQSLHTVNGFFAFVIMTYVIVSTKPIAHKVKLADLFRIGFWLYILYNAMHISSPNTDTIALMLAYYILLKWMEYSEDGCDDLSVYSFLCVLVVFATTVKVSVGILVLLVLYPAIELVRHRKFKSVIGHLVAGIAIFAPYLIRNVIVSGYWLYPYEITRIKTVDWIVPEAILKSDRAEIIAWGRGNHDIARNAEHIWQWLPDWFASIHMLWKIMMILSAVALVVIVVMSVCRGFKWQWKPHCLGVVVCIIGLFFWLETAPLPRYGIIYMVTLPCVAFAMIVNNDKTKGVFGSLCNKSADILNQVMVLIYIAIFIGYIAIMHVGTGSLIMQGDYANKATYIDTFADIDIAIAVEGDQTGYEPFPSTPYSGSLQWLELRGDSLKDGFKR